MCKSSQSEWLPVHAYAPVKHPHVCGDPKWISDEYNGVTVGNESQAHASSSKHTTADDIS